jgi:hypothetical protein
MLTIPAVTTLEPDVITGALASSGIVTIPGFLEVDDLVAESNRLLDDAPDDVEELGYSKGKGTRIERDRLAGTHPALYEAFDQDWMRAVAKGFFGSAPYSFNHDVIVVRDVVGTEHAARRPHYDRTPNLKFFVYLTDTTERTGAFCCLPGSHLHGKQAQAGNRAAGRLPAQADTRVLPEELTTGLVPVEGAAGTLLVIDSDIVHLCAPVRERYRLAVRSRSYDPTLG